jgi:tetratricopeptide (TPR) repeat protein
MTRDEAAGTGNTIGGGNFYAPVLQGRDIQATFQLPAAAPTALAQLPPEMAAFTGRDDELAVLAGLLDPGGADGPVLVSAVAGLAGVGKTTLAIAAGHTAIQRGWFPGGVLFIDLHGYDQAPVEPARALDALLRALGVPAEHIPPGTEERAGLYRSVLAQAAGPVLVIADNASSEAQVRPLLPGGGPHAVLVTSRHTLAGLRARLVDVTVLDQEASMALLDAALRVARPGDDRISADPTAARRLARICGGLPLALQITAALLTADPALTASELANDLAAESARLDQLAYDDGSKTGAPSVTAAFEFSYSKLNDIAARVFRLLPVNPGPDISTAAAAVLADVSAREVRVILGALARAHLAETAPGTTDRWRMHDLVRLYAQQLSDTHAQTDRREEARDRLLGYYLDMAHAAHDHLRALPGVAVPDEFTGRGNALVWLDAERASLETAVTMAAETGQDQTAVDLSLALSEYLAWRRRFDDWIAITTIGLNAARRLGDRNREGRALNNLGLALHETRRFEEAITAFQDAAPIFQEARDRHTEGRTLNNLGVALRDVGRFDEAITAHQDALAIFRETADRHREGGALHNLGLALREVDRFDEAITAHQDALAIYRETGDRHGEGGALQSLGNALQQVQRSKDAIRADQDALAIYRETGDRHGEGTTLHNLGVSLLKTRRLKEAVTAFRDAAAIYQESNDRHGEGRVLNDLGLALREVGRFGEAITAFQDAAAILGETGDEHRQRIALDNLKAARRRAPWPVRLLGRQGLRRPR